MEDSQANFDAIPIGLELGPVEVTLDEETVGDRVRLVQWQTTEPVDDLHVAPPGITISQHSRMKFEAIPAMRVSIWAKSEHEFLKPMKLGSKVTIRGRVTEKYIKRDRRYAVTELETVDENGEVLMRSRETGVYVE